jgi:7-cyano-7-deazaguanine synthase
MEGGGTAAGEAEARVHLLLDTEGREEALGEEGAAGRGAASHVTTVLKGDSKMESKKAVVLLSGGLDSSTLLYQLLAEGKTVIALSVHYGQRHAIELSAARRIAGRANVELVEVALAAALLPVFDGAQSSQVGRFVDVPEGHYADENMKLTVVPGRNLLLIATAAALAVSRKAGAVAYAAHAGDHPVYPDCRPDFIEATRDAIDFGYGLELDAPFARLTKAGIVAIGSGLDVPFHLTRSCYTSSDIQCGRCSTCVERREAFDLAGVDDPTVYSDTTDFWKKVIAVRGPAEPSQK